MATTVALLSDLHCNSTVGLCSPTVNLDDGGTYRASKTQRWIWRQWLTYWQAVEEARGDGPLIVILNGELADDNYHPTTQLVTRNPADMLKLSAAALEPMLSRLREGDYIYVTRGTEAHSGPSAHLDETIAHDIGAVMADRDAEIYSFWRLKLDVEGVRFDIAHHPPGGGGRVPWMRNNFAAKLAAMSLFDAAARGEKAPHLLVRGHVHAPGDSYDAFAVRALVLPSWQLTTSYGHRIGGDALPVGGAIVTCEDGRATVAKYFSYPPIEGYSRV
jgi:hypothetical protein